MTFNDLSNEAKLLLIIGEPLRNKPELRGDAWLYRIWIEWIEVAEKGREEFNAAFGEISNFVTLKKGKRK